MVALVVCPGYLWYAAYGSNLSATQFMRYLNGGVRFGAPYRKRLAGGPDESLPEWRPVTIPHPAWFGEIRTRSDRLLGRCFLDPSTDGQTLGRAYLLSVAQLRWIAQEENRGREVTLTAEQLRGAGGEVVAGQAYGWLNQLPALGDGLPVVTFTSRPGTVRPQRLPEVAYLEAMREGLRETYPGLGEEQISCYLESVGGQPVPGRQPAAPWPDLYVSGLSCAGSASPRSAGTSAPGGRSALPPARSGWVPNPAAISARAASTSSGVISRESSEPSAR